MKANLLHFVFTAYCLFGVMLGNLQAQEHEKEMEEAKTPSLNLTQLIEYALTHYPGVQAKQQAIVAAQAQLSQAYISPFFQFQTKATFAVGPEARGTAFFSNDSQLPLSNQWKPITYVGVEGAIPLYTFGKLSALWDAAEAGVEASEFDLDRTKAKLVFDIRKAYLGLMLALDVQQMLDEGNAILEKAVNQIEEKIENDDDEVTELDRWRLASTVAEIKARQSETVKLRKTTKRAVKTLTGVKRFAAPECPMEPIEFQLKKIGHFKEKLNRPELGMLKAAQKAQQAKINMEKGNYFPEIGLGLSASYSYAPGITDQNNPFIQDNANRTALGVGLVARWSLDIWGNSKKVEKEEAKLSEIEFSTEEAQAGVDVELSSILFNIEDAQNRVVAWQEGTRETRAWFVSSAQSFQVGALESRELVDAVKAYFNARYNYLKSVFDLNQSIAALEKALGTTVVPEQQWNLVCE